MPKGTADTSLVKSPHTKVDYTVDQLKELSDCMDPIHGPYNYMTKFMMIQHPTRGALLFSPYDYQIELIDNYHNYRHSINMLGRQMGKCVTGDTSITLRDSRCGTVYVTNIKDFYLANKTAGIVSLTPFISWVENASCEETPPRSGASTDTTKSSQVLRKFTDIVSLDKYWQVMTDTGWETVVDVKETIEYTVWQIELSNGLSLKCADDHVVFDQNMNEVFVKDLVERQRIQTESGLARVTSVTQYAHREHMYDLAVDSAHHRYYTDGILSHNTTVAAGYLLWYGMFVPDSTILIASNKGKNAGDIMRRIRYAYENTPDHIRAGVTEYNLTSITFDNGSRIVAETTTETTGRGMSISLAYLDEFAFVRNSIAKEFWTSLSPTLSTGGKCIITSTPNSDDDQFANIWSGANKRFDEHGYETEVGVNGFRPYIAIWSDHPDRDEAWADQERNSIGEERFKREHQCQFVIYDETLINSLKLVELAGVDPIRRMGAVRWYQHPRPDLTYVVALDPSLGTGSDPAAIQVLELPSMIQVAEWQHNKTPIEGQIKVLMEILQYLKELRVTDIYWTIENNTIGEAGLVVIRDTGEENFPGEFLTEPNRNNRKRGRAGYHTSHPSKVEACARFKQLVERDRIKLKSKVLISELKTFVAKGNSYAAKPGEHDDLVMSMLLCVRMLSYLSTFNDDVYAAVNSSVISTDILSGENYDDPYDAPMPLMFI